MCAMCNQWFAEKNNGLKKYTEAEDALLVGMDVFLDKKNIVSK